MLTNIIPPGLKKLLCRTCELLVPARVPLKATRWPIAQVLTGSGWAAGRPARAINQRRKTTHLIAQYMYTPSQIPASTRDSWYCTSMAVSTLVIPRIKVR